jgi:hypothetical protein
MPPVQLVRPVGLDCQITSDRSPFVDPVPLLISKDRRRLRPRFAFSEGENDLSTRGAGRQ